MSGKAELHYSAVNGPTPRVAQPQARVLKALPSNELDPCKSIIWEECYNAGLALQPHEEYVTSYKSFIDQRYYLVHSTTLERVILPCSDISRWELAFDEDGFGGVYDDAQIVAGGEPFLLENLFKQLLCRNIETSALQVYDRSSRNKKVVIWDLEQRQRQFISFDVDIKVGSLQMLYEHPCFQMSTCRGGSWFFWGCIKLYSTLGLKSYCNKPSKWVYESSNGWRDQLQGHGFYGKRVIASRRSSEASGTPVTPRGADPCSNVIPEPVMSSLCLLNCLFVWGVAKPQQHGLRSPKAQAAALSFARGLLKGTVGQKACTFPLYFFNDWKVVWPNQQEMEPSMRIDVVDGMLQLEGWVDHCQQDDANQCACEWLREVQVCTGASASSVDIFEVLKHIAVEVGCKGLFRQLLWFSTMRLELVLAQCIKTGVSTPDMVKPKLRDIMKVLWQPRLLGHELYKYVTAAKQASDPAKVGNRFTFQTDKANVCGLSLTNTIVGLPNNVAFHCPPQALLFVVLYVCFHKQCELIGSIGYMSWGGMGMGLGEGSRRDSRGALGMDPGGP